MTDGDRTSQPDRRRRSRRPAWAHEDPVPLTPDGIDARIFRPGQVEVRQPATTDEPTVHDPTRVSTDTKWTLPPASVTSPRPDAAPGRRRRRRKRAPWARRSFRLPIDRYVHAAEPLDQTLALNPGDAEMEVRQARRVVDLVTRVAVMAIQVGASASEAIAMALRITATYGVTVHIDITNTSVIVTQHRGLDDDPITALRVVRTRTNDYQRLGELQQLVDDICDRNVELEQATERLGSIMRSPRLYRRWFVTFNMGLMGAGLSTVFGGTAMDGALSFISTCLVDLTVQAMARKRITSFFIQAAGGAVATVFALLVMVYMAHAPNPLALSPSLIVASGIVFLLAGSSFVAASQDALDGYVVTSSGRFLEGFVQTGGIILGVIVVMWIGMRLGVPGYISPTLGFSTNAVLQTVCAAVISVTFGVTSHAGHRTLVICAGLGAAAWVGYLAGMQLTNSVAAASGLGAMVAGLVAALGARRWKIPQVGLVTIAVMPLMPGVMMYRALYMIVNSQNGSSSTSGNGWTVLLQALLVGVALAVGSSFGALLARPFVLPKDRRSRRATLAAWGAGQVMPRDRRHHSRGTSHPGHPVLTEGNDSLTSTWSR